MRIRLNSCVVLPIMVSAAAVSTAAAQPVGRGRAVETSAPAGGETVAPEEDSFRREVPEPPEPDTGLERPSGEPAPAPTQKIDLSTLRTEDLSMLYFDPQQTYLTPYVGRAAENALRFHKEMFDWEPWDRTTLLLKDFGDYGNAAARSSPNNAVLLDVAPLSLSYDTFSPGERFFSLTNHELAHVATMDVWNERDAFWRRLFGGKPMPVQEHPESILWNYLTTPRVAVPRWYLEGSAVFMETWMAGGLGRAQGAYDEMVFRAKVRDNATIYTPLGLVSEGTAVDFQVGVNAYLYGTRFFSYLALTYSPEQVIEWLSRGEDSAAYYSVHFARVFGKSLDDAWDDWIVWERGFQAENLAALEQYPLTYSVPLASRGLGSVSRAYYDRESGSLVGAFRYPGTIAHVGKLSLATGEVERLADIKGAMLYRVTSIAFDPDARKVFYTEDNYAYRDIIELDLATGEKREILTDTRIGDLAFNPADRSLWGIRHLNGYATLVRIPYPYAGFNQIHTFDYGQTPFDLDISPDGTMVSASFGEVNGQQSVRVWRTAGLQAGIGPVDVARLSLPGSTPEGFVFSPDGRYLYGSAYFTGVSNIYRFEIATQEVEAVSNASTGFFRPIPQPDGSLIVQEYGGEGFIPVRIQPEVRESLGNIRFLGARIASEKPIVREWGVGSPARVPLDELVTERGKYDPAAERKFAGAYPVVEGYQGEVALGYHAIFEDPLQFNQILATVSYTPFEGGDFGDNLHVDLQYKTLSWTLRYWHNDADFYDLFGPVERSRKGDAFLVGYHTTKIYDPPRQLDIFADAAVYFGLEQLPDAQNVGTGFDTLYSAQAGASYSDTTQSLGAVDHEKGVEWRAIVSTDGADGQIFPKFQGGLNFGAPVGIPNSSVWLYTAAGVAGGNSDYSLSRFYFGAFGNNYVDNRDIKRYRSAESFPGFEINEISARHYARVLGEWNLPPLRFSGIGAPGAYLSSVRPALFAGLLYTDTDMAGSEIYQTLGFQLDWNMTVAHRLPMVFSLGVAAGFEDGDYESTEVMASLKVM